MIIGAVIVSLGNLIGSISMIFVSNTNTYDIDISDIVVKEQRLAIASFLDNDQLHGIFSIHNQIAKYNMKSKVSQVVLVPNSIKKKVQRRPY